MRSVSPAPPFVPCPSIPCTPSQWLRPLPICLPPPFQCVSRFCRDKNFPKGCPVPGALAPPKSPLGDPSAILRRSLGDPSTKSLYSVQNQLFTLLCTKMIEKQSIIPSSPLLSSSIFFHSSPSIVRAFYTNPLGCPAQGASASPPSVCVAILSR